MISLEQIRLLEAKITKAVELIRSLKKENASLRHTLDSAQARMQDLERMVGDLKTDQKEIEAGIVRALENLDHLEDEVSETQESPGEDAAHKDAEEPSGAQASEATSNLEPEREDPAGDEDSERELDIF